MSSVDLQKNEDIIRQSIYTVRGLQVMLDSDLADFYGVETRRLNEQVKRNIDRFPPEFMFQLTTEEFESLRSQFAISKKKGGRRYLPYAFTEQGVAMLSTVLHSDTAVKISIQIMKAFVAMRRFLASNAQIFQRLDTLEMRQLETDKKVDNVLNALESKELKPKQGIFFEGQIFDAYKFVSDLVRSADDSIVLIDNYIDDTVLDILNKRKKNVKVKILSKIISKEQRLDVKKYNAQYPEIEIKEFSLSHDRFLIIDNKSIYLIGASLKDLGKKWFAFSKIEQGAFQLLEKLDIAIKGSK